MLEDDVGMRRLLAQSDNGTSAGPSGWGGNMLSILVQSDICRLGVIALLRDVVNGDLPDDARQLLLASRLVALTKPNSDGYRPIAVGELFYQAGGHSGGEKSEQTRQPSCSRHTSMGYGRGEQVRRRSCTRCSTS